MILTHIKELEGVRFYEHEIVPPPEIENGVPVEYISYRMGESVGAIARQLRLKYVGEAEWLDAGIYVHTRARYVQYKCIKGLLRGYWWGLRFLYDNARMFKQIPPGECFSWRYFTPYVWVRKIRRI